VVETGIMPRGAECRWRPENLTRLREGLRLSPEELARRVAPYTRRGLTAFSGMKIRRWEQGLYCPTVWELEAICRAFQLDLTYFLIP
jgi:hypothetical protein